MATTTDLFWLQSELEQLINIAVGNQAKVQTVYDLARAKGELSNSPAIYLLPDTITVDERQRTSMKLSQRWEVSISVPVSVTDTKGNDAMESIGRLAMQIISALHQASMDRAIAGVRAIELASQQFNTGLIGNRLVIPFTFIATWVANSQ